MLEFSQNGDERGHLVVVEGRQDIPFDIKRIFYIYGSDEAVVRGQHANHKSQFVLINVAGSCKVKVCDGKGNEAVFLLTDLIPEYICPVWYGRRCMILVGTRFYYVLPANIMMPVNI